MWDTTPSSRVFRRMSSTGMVKQMRLRIWGKCMTTTNELKPDAFVGFLSLLSPDPEIAGEKYEELRQQLIKFFEWRGSHIADELADETLNRVIRKIDEGEEIEKNILALSLGIARFVFMEYRRLPDNRRVEIEELFTVAAPLVRQEGDDDLWLISLKECLSYLSDEDRELIIEYYQEDKQAKIDCRKALAAKLGISINSLFSRAKRIRDRLERSVMDCVERKSVPRLDSVIHRSS
jgi:DNA-directed RNA polymerase specialized sigma24 family protein